MFYSKIKIIFRFISSLILLISFCSILEYYFVNNAGGYLGNLIFTNLSGVMGFIGSLIVIRPGYLDVNLATIAGLGTGFFYGIYLVITRKLHSTDSPLLTLLLTGVVGAIIASFFVPVVWISPTFNQWLWLGLMGIFACLGHICLIYSLKYADASKLAPFGYFEIIPNIILGYLIFSDFPDIWTFAGLSIICLSGYYVFRRELSLSYIKGNNNLPKY